MMKRKKGLIWLMVAVASVMLVSATVFAFVFFGPLTLTNGSEKRYIVSETTTVADVADELAEMGIVRSATGLQTWATMTGRSEIVPGIYVFSTNMPVFEIGDVLTDGQASNERILTFIEGATIPEVAQAIADALVIPTEDVLKVLDDQAWVKTLQADYWFLTDEIFAEGIKHPLEGYLAADTYFVQADNSVEAIVVRLLDQMELILEPFRTEIEAFPLSVHEMLTLTSIVEREASEFSDRQMVAGVFLNRLEEKMTLGSDVTVAYALGKVALNFTMAELQTESPYNTYVIQGLPVGPVGNPGAGAIEAVLTYEANEYLYFLADVCSDGTVYYAKTYEEHLALRDQYLGCIDE